MVSRGSTDRGRNDPSAESREPDRGVGDLSLVGGHPALDFTNTVSWRGAESWDDRLRGPDDLRAWGARVGLLDAGRASDPSDRRERELFARALDLREAIHDAFAALAAGQRPAPAALDALSLEWAEARARMSLFAERDGAVGVRFEGGTDLERLIWALASSAGDLLLDADPARIKTCAGAECGYLYVDASRNRSRRWCDMAECGNRAKVRRFREKGD
ncbi:MAG TPA: ABATE domain-containing protein [Longimicrobiales bacterium]|nr:ABATE domain-containing protein [Longimicrobiales bacterium]